MKVHLFAPPDYWKLTPEQLNNIIGKGGCGPGGFGDYLVPDKIWGLEIKPACQIHDYMYAMGYTVEEKQEADRVFMNNMLRLVDAAGGNWLILALRRSAAAKYYRAVADFGGPSFWRNKNTSEQMQMVEVS